MKKENGRANKQSNDTKWNQMKWKLTNEKLAENNKVVAMALILFFFCSNPFACDNIFI